MGSSKLGAYIQIKKIKVKYYFYKNEFFLFRGPKGFRYPKRPKRQDAGNGDCIGMPPRENGRFQKRQGRKRIRCQS